MSSSQIFTFFSPTKIYLGINAHEKLNEILGSLGAETLFVLCDGGVARTEIFERVQNILRARKVRFEVFTEIEPDPSVATVEKAFDMWRALQAPALLAVGGGSTMDVGKAVGILATNGGRIQDYEGIDIFSKPLLPLIAIPTTAGTGSEVSAACVITDTERNVKMSIRNAALNPAKIAILDPVALKSLPATVASHSALDAFVHAFESYISKNANPMTDAINLHAMKLIARHVRSFVAKRDDLEAGLNMLCASNLAGMTFGLTGLGNVHCMSRIIGVFFHLSHGFSNALCLPAVAEFNFSASMERYAEVAKTMGQDLHGLTTRDAGKKAVRAIQKLCRDLGIPPRLTDVDATEEKINDMARQAFESDYNRWNPRYTTYEDFIALYRQVL